MRPVLFRKIFLSYLIIVPLLLISLELYLSGEIKNSYISRLKSNLRVQANLIAEQVPLFFKNNLDDFCRRYKEKTGSRITIIDSSGKVTGDSDESSERMENHSNRPEIREALISKIGSSIRFSTTMKKDFFYLAISLDDKNRRGFLRLSMPLHDMEKAISQVRKRIIFASLTALLIAILLGLFQTKRVTRSVEEITAFSKEVAAGNLERRLFLDSKDELAELGKNISYMAEELKTRLKQSEEERHRMEAILRNMSEGVMLTDAKGRVLLCNDAIKRLFNIESSIEGMTFVETLRNVGMINTINRVIESEETVSHEIEVTHPKELCLMVTAIPFYAYPVKEKVSGVILTLHDITRLKQLEEIRKDFVANVSHEIRTPITAIKGFAETLLEGAIDDKDNARKFLETIKNHSERLNLLVGDLLTLSMIELGEIRIGKFNINITCVIDTVFAILKDKADSKGLYLKKSLPPGSLDIYADKDRLTQILLNLVDNSIKFTGHGGVTVGIERAGEQNVLFVEDTGIGITKRHLPRLGERFYRVDRARSRELGGTGLGLAIVKHLVKAHGWDMDIESTPGKGTIVRILVKNVTEV